MINKLLPVLFGIMLLLPASCPAFTAQNVFIVILDEGRHDEILGDKMHAYTPNIWNAFIPKSSWCVTFYGNPSFMAQVHLAVLTGSWNDIRRMNPKTNPDNPTIFEYYRKKLNKPESSCYFVSSRREYWYLEYSKNKDYGKEYKPFLEFTKTEKDDIELYQKLVARMKKEKPSLVVVVLGGLKSYNKKRRPEEMDRYRKKITDSDKIIFGIWKAIQSLEPYKDKTDMFFVNDHGDLITHEDCDDECKRYMDLFAIGPDFKQNYESKKGWRQICIFHTALKILGIEPPDPKSVMEDFFKK